MLSITPTRTWQVEAGEAVELHTPFTWETNQLEGEYVEALYCMFLSISTIFGLKSLFFFLLEIILYRYKNLLSFPTRCTLKGETVRFWQKVAISKCRVCICLPHPNPVFYCKRKPGCSEGGSTSSSTPMTGNVGSGQGIRSDNTSIKAVRN